MFKRSLFSLQNYGGLKLGQRTKTLCFLSVNNNVRIWFRFSSIFIRRKKKDSGKDVDERGNLKKSISLYESQICGLEYHQLSLEGEGKKQRKRDERGNLKEVIVKQYSRLHMYKVILIK